MPDPAGRYPSVTQIIGPFADFGAVHPDVLAAAADRGTRVHAACATLAEGLWLPKPDQDCQGYVDSFQGWFERAIAEVVAVERRLYDEALGFCGQLDLLVLIQGDSKPTLVDLKTPAVKNRLWAMQLAAYRHLALVNGLSVERIASLRLKKDGGTPIVDEYTSNPNDFAAFASALNVWRYLAAA
ncbi:MAG: hypothetical protein KQJ78_19560 [Deltaproteobacteria bacterium]|nr:hypothetical protein [Deltaproteobacteria bacterium]